MLQCDTRDSKFHQFLKQTQKNQVLNLYDTLILPVQRLPRYQLLLQAIQKYFSSSPYSEDKLVKEELEEAIQIVISMNVAVDKALKKHENRKQMKEIASQFHQDYYDFFDPNQREFLKKGTVSGYMNYFYLTPKQKQLLSEPYAPNLEKYTIIFLSDQIILAAPDSETKSSKLHIHYYLNIDGTFFMDTSKSMGLPSFQLVSPHCGFTFSPKNKSEFISWKSCFKNALSEITEKNPSIIGK